MNHLFLTTMVIAAIVCLSSCQKDDLQISNSEDTALESIAKAKEHKAKVYVCHKGKTINVSSNAVGTHQSEHGDAVDMDGDGYFNMDCDCGPTDCDDTDATLTDNCCPTECGFCEYIDLFDFDEPCEDGRRNRRVGDWYGSRNYSSKYLDSYGCEVERTYGFSRLYDHDNYNYRHFYCNNDTNNENDRGHILTYWSKTIVCGVITFSSYTRYSLRDYSTGGYKVPYTNLPTTTEEGYKLAKACGKAIDELATELGMTNRYAKSKALNGKELSQFEEDLAEDVHPAYLEGNLAKEMKEMHPEIQQ